jgi:hypothetical protein
MTIEAVMETVETYLARKKQELELLNSFLSDPLTIRPPRSVAEVIEQKFHLAAALKAEHDIVSMPNSYGETTELIDGHGRHLRRVELGTSLAEITNFRGSRPRILLLDSCASAGAFEEILKCAQPQLDLIVFDTTCFSSGSGRIARALGWAQSATIPIVLLRSHTKLDSLGVEYGRLGSAVFAHCPHANGAKQQFLQALLNRDAQRRPLIRRRGVTGAFPALRRSFGLPLANQ